jgi:hypothetical protein
MLQIFLKALFTFVALGTVTGGAASAEGCSGSITAESWRRDLPATARRDSAGQDHPAPCPTGEGAAVIW